MLEISNGFSAKQIRAKNALIANLPGTLKIKSPEEHLGDLGFE